MVNTVISSSGTTYLDCESNAPFTGTFAPNGYVCGPGSCPLFPGPNGYNPTVSSFPGLYSVPNGNWTLAMEDRFVCYLCGYKSVGYLKNWTIAFDYSGL